MATPFVISALLGYFQNTIPLSTALFYGFILCLGVAVNAVTHHPLFLYNNLTGMKLRLACTGLIYKKVPFFTKFISLYELFLRQNYIIKIFKYDFCGKENEASGRILNLITNDVGRLELVTLFLTYLIIGPLEAIFIIYILYQMIDIWFLTGLVIMCILVSAQSIITKYTEKIK